MKEKDNKTIIFVETKRRVDDLTRNLRRDGFVPIQRNIDFYLFCTTQLFNF